MLKNLLVIIAVTALAMLAPKPVQAQSAPAGAGWYFFSVCAYYGTPASWLCGYGPFIYFGPFTTEASCTSTLQLMLNTNSPLITDPYAPSNCFYMN